MLTRDRANSTITTIAEIREFLGERLSTAMSVRDQHGKDQTWTAGAPPDAVAFVRDTSEVQKIVKICARHQTPIIAYGTGTSLEGHITAPYGGITVDLSQMNNILSVNAADLDARVEAGVTRKTLNTHLRDQGLFFPIDPGADATLGGMASTRASGTNAVRYGTMRENVLGLTIVTADGRVMKTGGRARKSAAGYDLTRLFVGSEGTLGVITEVRLRLYGIPETMAAAVTPFPTIADAVNTVIRVIQSAIPVARIELLDEFQMKASNSYSKLDYAEQPTLFIEFHGSEAAVAEQVELVKAIAADYGGGEFRWSVKPEERTKLWQARHDAYYAGMSMRPGSKGWPTDVCVPISRLADCIVETRKDIEATGLVAMILGHVGDGNFHTTRSEEHTSE